MLRDLRAAASAAFLWSVCSLPALAVPLETLSNGVADGAIKIGEGIVFPDGTTSSFGDWAGVTAYQSNTHNGLVQSIAIANDSQYYYFKYTFNTNYNINDIPAALNLYIDADSSKATGVETWWGSDDLGVDLLAQGVFLYDFPGLGTVETMGTADNPLFPFASANGMEFRLERDAIGDGDAFNFQFLEQDAAWAIADIYPYCRAGTGGDTGKACETTSNPLVEWPGIQPYFRYVAGEGPVASVPEPGTLGLLGIVLVGIGLTMTKRWNRAVAR